MSLNFSQPIKYSGDAYYSPNDKYIAISKSLDLIIYDTATLKIIQKFSFSDYVETIKWSNDSTLVLVGLFKRGVVEIKQIQKPTWICRINEGLAGISYAYFAPDSRSVITICNNNLKMSIWSLVNKSISQIQNPKFCKKGVSFTSNGHFMALAIKTTPNDSIGVYFLGNWSELVKFPTKCKDLSDVKWSYDNSTILVSDTPLVCALYIYTPTGELLNEIVPYEYKLGIRQFNISPNGRFISLGCYDQSVKIYYNISYTMITEFFHNDQTNCFDNKKVNYFKEEHVDNYGGNSKYISIEPPVDVVNTPAMYNDIKPKMGVCKMEYSYDSNFLATVNENSPNVIFIWELMGMNLHTVIIQLKNITDFKWCPNVHVLFILTGTSKLFYFTLDSIFVIELPVHFSANTIHLNTNGRRFILNDPDYMIVGNFDYGNVVSLEENKEGMQKEQIEGSDGEEGGAEAEEGVEEGNEEEQIEEQQQQQQFDNFNVNQNQKEMYMNKYNPHGVVFEEAQP